jgi:hypothetical protein
MPISHVIDHQRRWMTTVATGPIALVDLQAHWAAELAEGGEGYPELVDATGASVAFDSAEVRRMVEVLRIEASNRSLGPTAVVVQTDFGFGMVRMFGILVEPFCEIRPFRDLAAAEAWLTTWTRQPEEGAAGTR